MIYLCDCVYKHINRIHLVQQCSLAAQKNQVHSSSVHVEFYKRLGDLNIMFYIYPTQFRPSSHCPSAWMHTVLKLVVPKYQKS